MDAKKNTSYNETVTTTTISYNDSEHPVDNTVMNITENNSLGEHTIVNGNAIALGDNSVAISSINNSYAKVDGSNVAMVDGKAYLDGKEIEIDEIKGLNISYSDKGMTINGKPPKFKNSNDTKSKKIVIKLSGKDVKIPLSSINALNSSFDIVQKCSPDKTQYFTIDSALQPHLKSNVSNGVIRLKNGSYTLHGKPTIVLFTQPLNSIDTHKVSNIDLSCINKNKFSLENSGMNNVTITNIDSQDVYIDNSGSSEVVLQGSKINNLKIDSSGIGKIRVDVKVNNTIVDNSGSGTISIKDTITLDAENSSIGEIDVAKVQKVLRAQNEGIGSINY